MIKSIFYLSCCTALFSSFQPIRETPLEPGSLLPKSDVVCKDVSGKNITLNAAKGANGLLVIFGSNVCPYMIRNQERLRDICTYAVKNNIGTVMVNSNEAHRNDADSYDEMKKYAADQHFSWYYIYDKNSVLANAFDANHTPECYLFDKNSKLTYKGGIDDSPGNMETVKIQHLRNAINEMLAGKTVTTNTSSSLGCNIKRNL
ncbi:redoxin domain-containing protein [Chitinophaga arvensicola]|uniref:Redoxin n=1 Tax=Chitinophaga arvensicola TaxID=29529 RepID=A0A1I0RBX9_9BACT|nr:redoxin domain-containing protein [Chitinophaga arvensicola]SEW38337.1 Redoxin [Chitinophaga arvensicola]